MSPSHCLMVLSHSSLLIFHNCLFSQGCADLKQSQQALSKRPGTPFINIKCRSKISLSFMFLPCSIYFNTQICSLCLIKSKAKYDLVQRQNSVRVSLKWGVSMCSTFPIPKTLHASLTTKTSQLAAENGLSPSARSRAFSWLKQMLQSPCWSGQPLSWEEIGESFMFYVVSHVLSRKVYSSLKCRQWKYMSSLKCMCF